MTLLRNDFYVPLNTEKSSYSEGETILVTGQVKNIISDKPVSVIVKAPNGNLVSIAQVTVGADKKFSTEVTAGGALMKAEGAYTVTVQYVTENISNSVTFEFGGSTIIPSHEPGISLISVQTDDNHYDEGDTIVISGSVSTVIGETPMTLQMFTEGNLVDISQIIIAQDGTYSHTVLAEGSLWNKQGEYMIKASYGEGNIAETEFVFSPKSNAIETTSIYEINLGPYGTFDIEYSIKGGSVQNMHTDSNDFALIVQIDATDEGTISLDLPREFIGAEKQNGTDDTFVILIDGVEVAYQESVGNSDSRIIQVNFEQGDSSIKIIGTYVI